MTQLFQEKGSKLPNRSLCSHPSLSVFKGLRDSHCLEVIKDPVWMCLESSACSQAQESQQGGAVQGRRLGVWDLSDPVMSLPGNNHYCCCWDSLPGNALNLNSVWFFDQNKNKEKM